MPTTYNYTSVTDPQATEKSRQGILDSAMTDKAIEYGTFDEDAETLDLTFTNALDAGDKTILDGIVASLPALDSVTTKQCFKSADESDWLLSITDGGDTHVDSA